MGRVVSRYVPLVPDFVVKVQDRMAQEGLSSNDLQRALDLPNKGTKSYIHNLLQRASLFHGTKNRKGNPRAITVQYDVAKALAKWYGAPLHLESPQETARRTGKYTTPHLEIESNGYGSEAKTKVLLVIDSEYVVVLHEFQGAHVHSFQHARAYAHQFATRLGTVNKPLETENFTRHKDT